MSKIVFLRALFDVLESLINIVIGTPANAEAAEATAESKYAKLATSGLVDCTPEFSADPEAEAGEVTYVITKKADAENPDVMALGEDLTDEEKAVICGIATATVVKTTAAGAEEGDPNTATFTDSFAVAEKYSGLTGAEVSVIALSGEVGLATVAASTQAADNDGGNG